MATLVTFSAADAQKTQVQTSAHPSARIVAKVDNAQRTKIAGTYPGALSAAVIGGRVAPSTKLGNLHLVLSASADQMAAFQLLTDQQQDKSSPNYHQWLTPETFGQSFGASSEDIAKITAWLQDQGLTVTSVAKSNRVITFAGSSGQIEAAFGTELHTVTLNGATHISNTTDISVPAALAGVVRGVTRLNDIYPRADMQKLGTVAERREAAAAVAAQAVSGGTLKAPAYGAATGTHYVAPGDVATIYNVTPLYTAGIDGTGTTIDILAQSNISLSDVETFRAIFGLPKNDPTIIVTGTDPGETADEGEAFLDAEWSGALATGAKVNFLVNTPSLEYGGIDASGLYAVDNNIGDIISLSYGGCESGNTAAGTAYFNTLWEQAAAQGQTVFVSSGDSSAAGCDGSTDTYANYGYGVNALGSSAYNVAVGGSTFIDYGQATYWNGNGTTTPFTNAISYIPEAPWNNSKIATSNGTYLNSTSTGTTAGSGIGGTGGGISIYTGRPSWQTGSGISATSDPNCTSGTGAACYATGTGANAPIAGLHRLVPDLVNISANNHDGALYCDDSICSITSSGGLNNAGIVGGTSVATPVQASLQALINQRNGGRQGNANFYYYALANSDYVAGNCKATLGTAAAPTVTLPAATCNFHDIVGGSNAVPTSSTDTTGIGFNSAVGYDPASGLGSMNVANVANNWKNVVFTSTKTTLAITPTNPVKHGTAQTITVNVTPTTGTGTPSGDFALIAQTTTPNGPFQYTLSNGSFTGLVTSANTGATQTSQNGNLAALPAGNYNVYAQYAGNGSFGGSISNMVPVSISKEASSVGETPYTFSYNANTGFSLSSTNTFTYGQATYVDTFVSASSSGGTPTGTLTFAITRNGIALPSLVNTLDPTGNSYLYTGLSVPAYELKGDYPALSSGSYVVTATYSGDNNFLPSASNTAFTVVALTPTVTFTAPTSLTSGQTATFSYTIANPSTAAAPSTTMLATGTVTFTDTTTGTNLGSCTLSGATCAFSTMGITTAGANNISAAYSGDNNYASLTKTATVTVGTLAAPTVTITATANATFGSAITLTATLSQTTATGTVSFFNGGILLGSGTVTNGVATFRNAAYALPAGQLSITAAYTGSTTFSAATSAATITVNKVTKTLTVSGPLTSTYGVPVMPTVSLSTLAAGIVFPPTGTITFYDGGTVIGSGSPLNFAQDRNFYTSNISVPALAAGTHTITASYSGDTNYNAIAMNTAGSDTITVAKATPALILSTANNGGSASYNTGSPVVLQVFVPGTSAQTAPTGALTFTLPGGGQYAGTPLVYSAAAGGFVSTLNLNGVMGAQSYVATVAADANYNAITSNTLLIQVVTGNVWIANTNNSVSGVSNTGTAITTSAVSGGGKGIAIDNSGDIWSLNANSLAEFSSTGAVISAGYTGGGLSTPTALTIDGAGLVWVTNGTNTLSVFNPNGTPASATAYTSLLSSPATVNVDGSGNLWITNTGDNSLTEVIGVATPVTTPQTTAVKNNVVAARP